MLLLFFDAHGMILQWTATIMQMSWKPICVEPCCGIGSTDWNWWDSTEHPPYSLDLAPCDFWAFPTLKRQLCGKRFSSDDEVRNATAAVLKGMSKNNLFHVSESFIKRCKKMYSMWRTLLWKRKNCRAYRVIWFWIKKSVLKLFNQPSYII
jgi:hypothetical protein